MYSRNSIIRQVRDRVGYELRKLTNYKKIPGKITKTHFEVHNYVLTVFVILVDVTT
jgi:hypothetical protein